MKSIQTKYIQGRYRYRATEAGQLLVDLLDHVIMGQPCPCQSHPQGWLSLRELGILFHMKTSIAFLIGLGIGAGLYGFASVRSATTPILVQSEPVEVIIRYQTPPASPRVALMPVAEEVGAVADAAKSIATAEQWRLSWEILNTPW